MLPRKVDDFLFRRRNWNWFEKNSLNIWNFVLLCLMWLLWKEPNSRTFNNIEKSQS